MNVRGKHIEASAEYRRIAALPRRAPTISDELLTQLTNTLRHPSGTMQLRPVQGLALHDIGTTGGLTAPIRVGGGKTLITLLAPYVLQARRPLLLLPAALMAKTDRERRELMRHWLIPRNIKMMSYQALGRTGAAKELELYAPDLIIADEGHRLKNPRAACTRRVTRYMDAHPETKFIILSGTLIKHSLRDFAKACGWSLKQGAPVPLDHGEIDDWSDALDEKVNPLTRIKPGVLGHDVADARAWFQNRMLETPGVVSTPGDQVACSLVISALEFPVSASTEANFVKLRGEWATPDGWTYSMATDIWRHARELALGMHYVWEPRPPDAWLDARKAWAKFVREQIKNSMYSKAPLDSELQVVNAVDRGELDDTGLLRTWRDIKNTFTINSKPVWHDDSALKACEAWMATHHGIVWCEHTFFAEELAARTGAPYYGSKGEDRHGNPIENEKGDRSVVASVAANGTGRNLQAFHENLITSLQPGADTNEQLLGRTHRDGQEADEVTVDVLLACAEHMDAWHKARMDAQMHLDVLGQPQKLLLADCDWPADRHGTNPDAPGRWDKTIS